MKIGLVSLRNEGGGCPPIGLAYIGTYLKKHLCQQIEVEIIDINFDDIYSEIKRGKFDLIGISTISVDYGKAISLAHYIKQYMEVPIIIGGVHISTLPSSFKPCFDVGVIGEGEETMLELVRLFLNTRKFHPNDLKLIDGIIFFNNGKIEKTTERNLIENMDSIPIPDWSLVDKRYFRYSALTTWGEFGIEGTILTSRGCPYKCVFCSTSQFWQRVRMHSPEFVLQLVKNLIDKYNVSHIQIWDDLFTLDKARLKRIAELLQEEGLTKKVKFNCQPRVDLIDDEVCRILRSMNVEIVLFGFESGSNEILRFLKRRTVNVEDNKRAIECCIKHGLKVQGSVIFGSPGETIKDMEETLDFIDYALKKKVNRIWSFIMTPFPATEMWQIAKDRGKVSDDMDWNLLSHQATEEPLLLDESIDRKEFKKIFFKARRKLNRFKWNKVSSFLKNNPLRTVGFTLTKPIFSLKLLFSKKEK